MQLSAKQAIVKTISVEIKALTLEKKQVTQSVFKQLNKRDLLNYETNTLNGVPWGYVNYHPDKCGDYSDHLHIVWQMDNNLCRDTIYKSVGIRRFEDIFNIPQLKDDLCRTKKSALDFYIATLDYYLITDWDDKYPLVVLNTKWSKDFLSQRGSQLLSNHRSLENSINRFLDYVTRFRHKEIDYSTRCDLEQKEKGAFLCQLFDVEKVPTNTFFPQYLKPALELLKTYPEWEIAVKNEDKNLHEAYNFIEEIRNKINLASSEITETPVTVDDIQEHQAILDRANQRVNKAMEFHKQTYENLENLDQLFIAV